MHTYLTSYVRLLGMVAVALSAWVPAVASAEERVDWINHANVTVSADTLRKTGGCDGCEDAGAVSRQYIWNEGYVEFSPGETNTFWLAGLSNGDSGHSYRGIDFAFRFNGAGHADVMESGAYQNGGDTSYAPGDVFRVAVMNGRVRYYKNGQLLRESGVAPQLPLVLDVSLGSVGATVRHARIATLADTFDGEGWSSAAPFGQAGDSVRLTMHPANRWTDTGIWVTPGDLVVLRATGVVQLSSRQNDVASPEGARDGRRARSAPFRREPAGTLIARIGNGAPLLVGRDRSLVADQAGRLYLGVNDDDLTDNTGAFDVDVHVQRR